MGPVFTDVIDAVTPDWLRHPGWRWERAMRYTLGGDPMLLRDPYVNDISKIYRCTGLAYEQAIAAACPEAYGAYLLHTMHSHRGGAKWQIEAYILAGASNEDLQDRLPMPCGPDTYEYYRKLFFDVDSYRSNPNCVLSAVLGYSSGMSNEFSDQDVAWKMYAYTQGVEAFDDLLWHFVGRRVNTSVDAYLREFNSSRALYYGYHIVQNAKLCFQEQLRPILNLADQMLPKSKGEGFTGGAGGSSAKSEEFANCVRHILGNIDVSLRNRNTAEIPAMPAGARQRLLETAAKA